MPVAAPNLLYGGNGDGSVSTQSQPINQADLDRILKEQEMERIRLENQRQALENQLKEAQMPDVKEANQIKRSREERAKDLAEGRARGQELFGTTNEADATAVAERIRAQAQGFTPEELSAMREQNIGSIQSAGKQNLRALRIQQAAQGVRGAQAIAQQGKMLNDQQNQLVGSERELFLKNIDARRQGVKDFQDMVNREKSARLTTELGFGSLGAADRGAVMQKIVGEQQAAASARAGGGGGGGKK